MILPEKIDFLDRNSLCFRQEEENKAAHYEYQASKKQENSILEMTK